MWKRLLILIVVTSSIGACATQTAEPTSTPTDQPSVTPSATVTSTPSPSITPTATITPTSTPTPTPSILDPSNVAYLRQFQVIPFEIPARFETAFWSEDSKNIVVWTDKGWQVLDASDLRVVESKLDESPLGFGANDQLIVLDRDWDVRYSDAYQTLTRIEPPQWYWYFSSNLIALSPDGNWLATVLGENEIEIISLSTGESTRVELRRNYRLEGIDKLVFNQDGSILAVQAYAYDFPVIVVDVASGEVTYEITNASNPSFSRDGSKLIVRGPNTVEIRNAYTGVFYQGLSSGFIVPHGGPYGTAYNIRGFSFVADNLTAAALYASNDNCQLIIWDLASGNPKHTIQGMPMDIRMFSISPDGSQLLTFTPDARLRIRDMATGEVLVESEPYQVENSYPSLNADGTMLAIPGIPQVKVIHLETGETTDIGNYADASRIRVAMVGSDRLAVEVSPTGWGTYVDLWDLKENMLVRTFKHYSYCLFNSSGSHMVCNSNLQLFEVESGRLLGSYGPDRNLQYEWALSADGKQIAVCSYRFSETGWEVTRSDNISIFDTKTNELRRLLTADERGICSRMAFSPDGQFLANTKGYVWSTRTASVVTTFETPSEYIYVSIDPTSQMILAGNELFNLSNGDQIGRLDAYGSIPPSFIEDGQFIAVLSENQVEYWGSNLQREIQVTPTPVLDHQVGTPQPTWTPQPAHCIDNSEFELSEYADGEFLTGRLAREFNTWHEIDQVFSGEEIQQRALEFMRCGASLNPSLISTYAPKSYATIIGWTGYINGIGKVIHTLGNTEYEILIVLMAYLDSNSASIVHLPVTICVGRNGNSLCNDRLIREDPTDSSPGNAIQATTIDEVALFLEDRIGKTLRGFFIFPHSLEKDPEDIVEGLLSQGFPQSTGDFLIDACKDNCYLNIMDGVTGILNPHDVESILYQTGEPWGFFLEGIYVFSE
jgi:WD40 repeat protein